MSLYDALTIGMVAPIVFIFALRKLFGIAPIKGGYLLFAAGAACTVPALVLEILIVSFGQGFAEGLDADNQVIHAIRAGLIALIEEVLKIAIIRRVLARGQDLTWRRFAILACWVGAGFAAVENWEFIWGRANDIVLRAVMASPMHVMLAVVAARLLWLSASYRIPKLTFAAFCLPIVLHALYDFLVFINAAATLVIMVAMGATFVFAIFSLAQPDDPPAHATL